MRLLITLLLGQFLLTGGSCERPEAEGVERPAVVSAETPSLQIDWQPTPLVDVPAGSYRPLYPGRDEPEQRAIDAFAVEKSPVTNRQYLAFVAAQPKWRRSQVRSLFADANYLAHWPEDLQFPEGQGDAPVTQISWFAARAYAAWAGRRLPTLAEWEYLAAASDTAAFGRDEPGYNQVILNWYARPTPARLPDVGGGKPNFYGVHDLHGLVWEWVDDYNSSLVSGESRGDAGLERNLFCGSGSIGAADPADYADFMRFAFRSSLEGDYTVRNLGFRCAADLDSEQKP